MSLHTSSETSSIFDWDEYLTKTNARPAEPKCFKQSRIPPKNLFEVNTLLEAEDQRSAAYEVQTASPYTSNSLKASTAPNTTAASSNRRSSFPSNPLGTVRRFRAAAFSLAQVVEVWGPRLRIRHIGTDDRNDVWFLVDSDQIRPYPSGEPLQPPFGYMYNHLNWSRTLKTATENAKFADSSWFVESPPDPTDNFFRVGDKLEAVDRHNTQLICPATVGAVNGQHIFVCFDGWSGAFDYWTRFDSRELFPVGWCKLADYPLQSPGPNALRSPTSQSTPAPTKAFNSFDTHRSSHTESKQTAGPPRFTKSPSRMKQLIKRNHTRTRRLHSRVPKAKRIKLSVKNQPHGSRKSTKLLHRVPKSQGAWPPEGVNMSTSITSSPHHNLADSADSSMRSLSSPPTIHPITEDLSGSLNLSGSSTDQPPPPIEVATQPETLRSRRTSSSSDCVVRLQAKSPPNLPDRPEYNKPEHKSWQVVPLTPEQRKKAPKRHRLDKPGRLRKKFKLVDTPPEPASIDTRVSDANVASKREVSRSYDSHSSKNNTATSKDATSLPKTSKPISSFQLPPPQMPLHLFCDDYNETIPAAYEPKKCTYPLTQSESASSGEQLDDEVVDSVTRSNGLWFPQTKTDFTTSKSQELRAAYAQVTDDYSDGQSLAPHVSSSTVSPSSLDLGPGPLPNPSFWTTDDVYQYLTTRDPSLTEVAQKFKHHEIDGQALLLLNMESLRNYLQVKLGPALKVDHLISRIKRGLL